jgi:hypothetical protein
MKIIFRRADGLWTFILLGGVCILCAMLRIVSSVFDWKDGHIDLIPADALLLVVEVFGAVVCFLWARLVIRGRKQDWQEQEKLIAERQASHNLLQNRNQKRK